MSKASPGRPRGRPARDRRGAPAGLRRAHPGPVRAAADGAGVGRRGDPEGHLSVPRGARRRAPAWCGSVGGHAGDRRGRAAVNPRLVEPVRHPWPDDPLVDAPRTARRGSGAGRGPPCGAGPPAAPLDEATASGARPAPRRTRRGGRPPRGGRRGAAAPLRVRRRAAGERPDAVRAVAAAADAGRAGAGGPARDRLPRLGRAALPPRRDGRRARPARQRRRDRA